MSIVDAMIELQVNVNVYNNLYVCDKKSVSEKIKSTFEYFWGLSLSARMMETIIDGVVNHPVNLRIKNPQFTDRSDIEKHMLSLREHIYELNRKHKHHRRPSNRFNKIRKTFIESLSHPSL